MSTLPALFASLASCSLFAGEPRPTEHAALVRVASGLKQVTDLQFQKGRMVASTQSGRLAWVEDGAVHTWRQVDVVDGSERGLLGVAFDPDYDANGRVVLSWTETVDGKTMSRIGVWTTAPGSKPGDAALEQGPVLFEIEQPWSNHNGGGIQFGPDGMLYVGLGDGGRAGDPLDAGQDGRNPLGAMLRLDPDLPAPHVPPDNPFVGDPEVHDAIFAMGLRNPWRFSFAPDGRLVAGDVGQNAWEEITLVPKGANLGWNHVEGNTCYERPRCDGPFTAPIWVYPHTEGVSVTGGYVATAGPLKGQYVFGDFGSGVVWATPLPEPGKTVSAVTTVGEWGLRISTFGRDEDGNVYLGDYTSGAVYRVDAPPQ
jgi:glucose/arabinose dehydrogenase